MTHRAPPPPQQRRGLSVDGVQKALLLTLGAGWLITVAATAIAQHGHVPTELWAVLPFGITSILVAFRAGGNGNGGDGK